MKSTFFCPTVLTQVARAEAEAKGDEGETPGIEKLMEDVEAAEARNINRFVKLTRRNSELERQNSELKRQKSELKRQNSELERQNSELDALKSKNKTLNSDLEKEKAQNIEVKNFMARYKGGS